MGISTRLTTSRAWFFIQVSYYGRLDKTVKYNWQYQTIFCFLLLGQAGVRSLVVDWLTGQLYWTSVTQKAIFTGAADGSSIGVVVSKDTDPSDVVLSPVERYSIHFFKSPYIFGVLLSLIFVCSFIFWINKGLSKRITIERAAMDGSNRTTLIFITAQLPKGLTLDVAARRLYWISEFKKVGCMFNY